MNKPMVSENRESIMVEKTMLLLPKCSIKNLAKSVEATTSRKFSHTNIVEKKCSGRERKELTSIAHFLFSLFAFRTVIFSKLISPVSLAVKIPRSTLSNNGINKSNILSSSVVSS